MTIQTLLPQDAAAFQALRLRALQERPEAFASSAEEEAPLDLARVAERLAPRDDAAVFGAWDGAALCGIVGIQREGMAKLRHKAVLWGLYVAPECRGAGHGEALIRHAVQHAARVLGCRQVNLGAHTGNEAALRLYRRVGFRVFGTEPDALCVNGQWQDEHHMVCLCATPATTPHAKPLAAEADRHPTLVQALQLRADGRHEQARLLLCILAAQRPDDAEVQFEAACVHDALGLEAQAVPFYRAALAGRLSAANRRRAFLGLGSTYRTLGRFAEARATLDAGLQEWGDAPELRAFLAMVLHNQGESTRAVESLLQLLVQTTADASLRAYARAIAFYAQDINRIWPDESV
jgi:ribosomal protein S18 acetylase RimI-like enzyme